MNWISFSTMLVARKVRHGRRVGFSWLLMGFIFSEFNDESFIVPRSTSLVAKRVPAARQGPRKHALQPTASASAGETPGSLSQPAYLRGRGAMSKRFDGRDEPPKSQTPVSSLHRRVRCSRPYTSRQPVTSIQTPSSSQGATGDEAAAMAAMFRAQTDVWEETQEKMSQSVLDFSSVIQVLLNNNKISLSSLCPCSFPMIVLYI